MQTRFVVAVPVPQASVMPFVPPTIRLQGTISFSPAVQGGRQDEHESAAVTTENDPAVHVEQASEPTLALYVPLGHAWQEPVELGEYPLIH
eukprot:512356-Hanusia_phi.AAC.1